MIDFTHEKVLSLDQAAEALATEPQRQGGQPVPASSAGLWTASDTVGAASTSKASASRPTVGDLG